MPWTGLLFPGGNMETAGRLRLADVFVSIPDPRQAAKVEHDLVESSVAAVNAVLVGADTFVEIEVWAKEKLDWLRGYLRLTHPDSGNAGAQLVVHSDVASTVDGHAGAQGQDHPYLVYVRRPAATKAFVGIHAAFTHVAPNRFRSISATRWPA
jgi:hypothetical protein